MLEDPICLQSRYDSGFPMTTAMTVRAMSIILSRAVLIKHGRTLSMNRMTVMMQ